MFPGVKADKRSVVSKKKKKSRFSPVIRGETFQAQTKDMVLRNSIIIIYNRMSFYVVLAVN